MLLPSGNPIKCHEEVSPLQPMVPPKRFDVFSPCLGDAQKVSMHSDFYLNSVILVIGSGSGSSIIVENTIIVAEVSTLPYY